MSMNSVTLCFSTHRPETLDLTTRVMREHDLIVLEEPVHPDFGAVLNQKIELESYVAELDTEYPAFTLGQYQALQRLHGSGIAIMQVEPYLDHLLEIQFFLADDHRPDEIEEGTVAHAVYCAERAATGRLIEYYQQVQKDDFGNILSSMNSFAQADAARFVLRDTLRAATIGDLIGKGEKIYIEAGSIHLLLYSLLRTKLLQNVQLNRLSIEKEAMNMVKLSGTIFSPGDRLTLMYIYGRTLRKDLWQLLCARSLIYSKIIQKEEILAAERQFPHLENEVASITAVRALSLEDCETLYGQIKRLSVDDAAAVVEKRIKQSVTI